MQLWCLNVIRTEARLALLTVLLSAVLCTTAFAQPSGLFGGSQPQFLEVDEAFSFHTSLDASDRISVHWTIAPEYYLYQDKFDFALVAVDGSRQQVNFRLPPGTAHSDEFFGDVQVYYQRLSTRIDLPGGAATGSRLEIRYQGCAEAGLCYPPQTRLLEIQP